MALFTDDVFMSMPPMPLEYLGRDAVGRFCTMLFGVGRGYLLRPTRANGQPAFGLYIRLPGGPHPAIGLCTVNLRDAGVCELSCFEKSLLPRFGLPLAYPD